MDSTKLFQHKLFERAIPEDYNDLINKPTINGVVVEGDKIDIDYKLQPLGNYAHLDSNNKILISELPSEVLGTLKYQGTWNARTNTPTLQSTPKSVGHYWIVSEAGTQFGLEFQKSDWIIAGISSWQKIDNSDLVTSVNNMSGDVKLDGNNLYYSENVSINKKIDDVNNNLSAEISKKANQSTTYTKTEVDNLLSPKATTDYVNTELAKKADKTYVDEELDKKADIANTLAGYGITNAYTKTEVDNALSSKANSSNVYTKSETYTKTEVDDKIASIDISTDGVTEQRLQEVVATKQDKLTFDSTPTLYSQNPVTSNGIKVLVDSKQDIITGGNGEVLYHNGTNVYTQSLLNEGMVVMNQTDMDKCVNNAPSFKEVFETWKPYSHLNGKDNAMSSELAAWVYDESLDTIRMPLNSESITGYVSPKTFSDYDITVRCYSNDRDDDQMGIVGAFAVDSTGKEHTMTFIASPYNNTGKIKWCCKVDHCVYDISSANKTSAIKSGSATSGGGWSATPTGITIHVKRQGNVFTATCSQFNSTELDSNTTMVINLDELSTQYPVLNNFKGSASWGYMSMSQPNSCYENLPAPIASEGVKFGIAFQDEVEASYCNT